MKRALVVALVVLTACGGSAGGSGDGSARLACQHFRNVAADAADGVLTDDELRDKLKEVHGDAQYSDEAGIAVGARQMLAAITEGDTDELGEAVSVFSLACESVGN